MVFNLYRGKMTEIKCFDLEYISVDEKSKCKHGDKPCKKCGTSKRDIIHTTKNGKGKVASLFKKKR